MPYNHKSRKHNKGKQMHVNTVDSATHLRDVQCMGRDAWDVAKLITIEQYAEARDSEQFTK